MRLTDFAKSAGEELLAGRWDGPPHVPGRACGACTLCCKLVPVPELEKPALVRCTHQRLGKGCAIYARRPMSCRIWSCRWLCDPTTTGLRRPDKVHYVIDMQPDYVKVDPNDGGGKIAIPVIQIWLDPAYPDAHRDPALRDWLALQGTRDKPVMGLARPGNQSACALVPPYMSDSGQWFEKWSKFSEHQHSAAEIATVMEMYR